MRILRPEEPVEIEEMVEAFAKAFPDIIRGIEDRKTLRRLITDVYETGMRYVENIYEQAGS